MSRRRHEKDQLAHRDRDLLAKQTVELIRKWATPDPRWVARQRRKKRRVRRILHGIFLMLLTPMVIIPVLIAAGVFAGRVGLAGALSVPALVLICWFFILNWMLKRPGRLPAVPAKGETIAALPAETEDWLEQQRHLLPATAHTHLDSIGEQLAALAPQLEGLDPDGPDGNEVKRLLSEELPELVNGYRKVPRALAQKPLYDGPSPERRLLDGLETIDKHIARLHERLAANDLKALATHQRYLELKYKGKDDIE